MSTGPVKPSPREAASAVSRTSGASPSASRRTRTALPIRPWESSSFSNTTLNSLPMAAWLGRKTTGAYSVPGTNSCTIWSSVSEDQVQVLGAPGNHDAAGTAGNAWFDDDGSPAHLGDGSPGVLEIARKPEPGNRNAQGLEAGRGKQLVVRRRDRARRADQDLDVRPNKSLARAISGSSSLTVGIRRSTP